MLITLAQLKAVILRKRASPRYTTRGFAGAPSNPLLGGEQLTFLHRLAPRVT